MTTLVFSKFTLREPRSGLPLVVVLAVPVAVSKALFFSWALKQGMVE
jgi:hypothetical protein